MNVLIIAQFYLYLLYFFNVIRGFKILCHFNRIRNTKKYVGVQNNLHNVLFVDVKRAFNIRSKLNVPIFGPAEIQILKKSP